MKKEVKDAKKAEAVSNAAKTVSINDIQIDLKQGRPMNPNSARQLRLAKQNKNADAKLNKSGDTRGRAVNPNSARQIKLKGFEVKVAAGVEIKRGRPASETSARSQKIAEREAKIKTMKLAKAAELGLTVIDA